MSHRAFVAFLAIAVATPAFGGTGAVKGSITSETGPVRDAVVLIEGPSLRARGDAPHVVIEQRDLTFVPHVVAVAVGTTVDFPNHDPVLHNVFSASPAKKFDLGMYGQGETKSVTFDKPGVVRILCAVHPKMEAFVVVHTNPYVAVSDATGSYTITGIPEGDYDLRVWHETLAERRMRVEIRTGQVRPIDVRLAPAH
jgi:plastocyanin